MVAFAESEFALNALQADEATLRHHLEVVWRNTGKKPQQLIDAKEVPPLGAHVWEWFLELNAERGSTGMAPSKITSTDIRDWSWATGREPELWERIALRGIDKAWFRAQNHG